MDLIPPRSPISCPKPATPATLTAPSSPRPTPPQTSSSSRSHRHFRQRHHRSPGGRSTRHRLRHRRPSRAGHRRRQRPHYQSPRRGRFHQRHPPPRRRRTLAQRDGRRGPSERGRPQLAERLPEILGRDRDYLARGGWWRREIQVLPYTTARLLGWSDLCRLGVFEVTARENGESQLAFLGGSLIGDR